MLSIHTGAIEYNDKALAIDAHNVMTLINKGWAPNTLRNYTGAIEYYDKALGIDPHVVYAVDNKGVALDELGNHTGALHVGQIHRCYQRIFQPRSFSAPFFYHQERLPADSSCEGPANISVHTFPSDLALLNWPR